EMRRSRLTRESAATEPATGPVAGAVSGDGAGEESDTTTDSRRRSLHRTRRGPAPPQLAAADQFGRTRLRVQRFEPLERTPVPRPVVVEVGGDRDRLDRLGGPQQGSAAAGALPPVRGGGGFPVGEDAVSGDLRHATVVHERSL